jgi:hypothetical protein
MLVPFSLMDYLEERGSYCNPNGVSLLLLEDTAIHVACDYPGVELGRGQALEIVFIYSEAETLMEALGVRSEPALEALAPETLLAAYENGRMYLSCLVERNCLAGVLLFQKLRVGLRARDESSHVVHFVAEDLRFGEDYVTYTAKYFGL